MERSSEAGLFSIHIAVHVRLIVGTLLSGDCFARPHVANASLAMTGPRL